MSYKRTMLICLVGAAIISVILGSSLAQAQTTTWYGYKGSENCWQTGQLGAENFSCDTVGAAYLPSGPHIVNHSAFAIGQDLELTQSGDFCSYYEVGDSLTLPETNNQAGLTGFETPTPFGNYQISDGHSNVCQASTSNWGQVVNKTVAGNGCFKTCGMHHWVSLHEQGLNDLPWASWYGGPTLAVSAYANPQIFTHSGSDVGAWGYVCPVLEERTTGETLEYCFQEWRTAYNAPDWEKEHAGGPGDCNSWGGHNVDIVQTFFYPGTAYSSESPGSANTFVLGSSGYRHYEGYITTANLQAAISGVNANCGRAASLDPSQWAVVGIEHGLEGWRNLVELGGASSGVYLATNFTPLPPASTTEGATIPSPANAIVTGTVNGHGLATYYHFDYGLTPSYGSSTPSNYAGSSVENQSESADLYPLLSGTTYHYRIVAENGEGRVTYGEDHAVTASGPTATTTPASKVGETTATMTGEVNPDGEDTHYFFEWGATTAYENGWWPPGSPIDIGSGTTNTPVSASVGELLPGMMYHYRIRVESAGGTSFGQDQAFTTATPPIQCSGSSIAGQGYRGFAPSWSAGFNTSTSATACSGTQGSKAAPKVEIASSSDGAAIESWGANGHAGSYALSNALIGTEEPPNLSQKGEIEAHETTLMPEAVATIPVAQTAIALVVHLPANCVADSKKNNGRLELSNVVLEGIFRGTITKWSQITGDEDALSGAGCNPETAIKPVVRRDEAGTTHILKRYLGLISGSVFETESGSSSSWNPLSEGLLNTVWPKAAKVVRPTASGEAGELQTVAETPATIGYANLADARANGSFTPSPGTGGPETARFWAPLQSNGLGTSGAFKFTDPSSNKDAAAVGEANCTSTEYTNWAIAFPPVTVYEPWNEVSSATTQTHYTLCGFAYVLALHGYSWFPGTSLGEAVTANNYLRYVVDSKIGGGQKQVAKNDYEALPKGPVLSEAQKGAEHIGF